MNLKRCRRNGHGRVTSITFDSFFGRAHLLRLSETEMEDYPSDAARYYDVKRRRFYPDLKTAARNYGIARRCESEAA